MSNRCPESALPAASPLPQVEVRHLDASAQPESLEAGVPYHTTTLGGWRPGTPKGIVPHIPQAQWVPCMRQVEAEVGRSGPHCWFLAAPDDGLLHCYECRERRPYPVYLVSGKPKYEHDLDRWRRYCADTGVESVPGLTLPLPADSLGDGGERVQLEARAPLTQHGAATPDQRASVAVGNVAEPQFDPGRTACIEPPSSPPSTPWRDRADFLEFVTERAAIFEYLGGFGRAAADRMAQTLADEMTRAA